MVYSEEIYRACQSETSNIAWSSVDEFLKGLRIIKTEPEIIALETASRLSERGTVSALNHLEGTVDAVSYPMAETAERLRVHAAEFGGHSVGHVYATQGQENQRVYTPIIGKV